MRFRPASRAIMTGATVLAGGWAAARADVLIDSPLIPTTSILSTSTYVPTSYVVPTTTILPTSSILTTGSSVYATSYYAPAAYTTSYYRGGLFRPRRYVERTSYYGGSGYLTPTSYYATPTAYLSSYVPTSYISSSSYVPTSYISSSSYLPTSYISSYVPTTYLRSSLVPTSYLVPTVSAAPIVPTTYLSRSVVTPTSYLADDAVVATSTVASTCCGGDGGTITDSTPIASPAVPTQTRVTIPSRPSTARNSGSPVVSQSLGESGTPGATGGQGAERTPTATVNPTEIPAPATSVPPTPKPAPEATSPPTPAPAPEPQVEPMDIPKAGEINRGADPGPAPKADEGVSRSSYRPVYSNDGTGVATTRNILRGRVVSFATGQPEEGVRVVLSNQGGFRDRTADTDADGEFKVSLPDGDWSVRITMPSGSVLDVRRDVVATAGRVLDAGGKPIREYQINR